MGREPSDPSGSRPRLFVIQKHQARALHWDLRLEIGGTLHSWAVPRGPSLDPADKRFAAAVEDHPIEYADFEGVIPEGEYGAGPVIVWDRGAWVPLADPEAGLESGKLIFELHGWKLRGVWELIRTKAPRRGSRAARVPREPSWLLVKKPDAHARAGGPALAQESILSGLLVEDLPRAHERAAAVEGELARLGAPARRVLAAEVDVMLAEAREKPFDADGWQFELKYDGYRLVAGKTGPEARLYSRRQRELTATFPEIARAVASLPWGDLVLDGEVVAQDERGRPSFQLLQQRGALTRPDEVQRAIVDVPVVFYVFDLLAFHGRDVRPLPLRERRAILARLLPRLGPVRFSDHVERDGVALFESVRKLGLEGVVGKRSDSPYRAGRSGAWVKVRTERTGDFAVVGWSAPKGARSGFGALHIAYALDGGFVYVGKVGSGFDERELATTFARLQGLTVKDAPCTGPIPRERGTVWVRPELVCEVRYLELTDEGILRQPTFLRFRGDKRPHECVLGASEEPAVSPPAPSAAPDPSLRRVVETNREKVFFPGGETKGDLLDYYRAIAPAALPYLRDRPVALTRYPDGTLGKSWFQHSAPGFAPGWLRFERLWSEASGREIDHFVLDDVESLLYVVNLGTIPLHAWASRTASLARPDWLSLDLDPKGAPWERVVRVANAARALLEALELPSFPKTSGSSGLHVLVPLAGQCTYAEARGLADLMAFVLEHEDGEVATTERVVEKRAGRIYIDSGQNAQGRTLAAAYCVRPLAGAPVSTPLAWREVGKRLDPRKLTIATVPARVEKKGDLLEGLLEARPDLPRALARLEERVRKAGKG